MKVSVTKQDIKEGQRAVIRAKSTELTDTAVDLKDHCAIAKAFQRVTKDPAARWWFASGTTNGKRYRAKRQDYVRNWVAKHDDLKKVEPFNFIVEYLDEVK